MNTYPYINLFPGEFDPPISPMASVSERLQFVYLTNRNHCTYLFRPRLLSQELLYERFPMGYSTLFVLERFPESQLAADNEQSSTYLIFCDPGCVNVGSGATGERFADANDALREARSRSSSGLLHVAVKVIDTVSWH